MSLVEELENSIDIVDLVSKYTKLKKAGANYKCNCPFPGHNEKTPSFMVSPAKQLAYCFGCHKWGWPLKFIMDIENCEFKEAINILAQITWKQISWFNTEKFETNRNMYSLYKDASNYYKQTLKKYPEVLKYLSDRGINNETIEKFHFWYSDSGLALYNYLREKWYDDNMIYESKIFVDIKTRKDKFINRVIFPIQNLRWDFIAFTARIIWVWEPKYLNSPASEYYDKSAILYWLYTAKNEITKKDFVIITEWQMDTISMQAAGFLNTVAVSGSALTEKHLSILKRLTHKLYLCFDSDSAWEKATKLALEIIKNKWFEVKIILLPNWKDPDDIIKSGADFSNYVQNALSPIWYYINKSNFDLNSLEDKKKLLNELLIIIKSFSDNLEKDYYLKEIVKKLDFRESIVYDSFNKIRIEKEEKKEDNTKKTNFTNEELAIWYIIYDEKTKDVIKNNLFFKEQLGSDLELLLENKLDFDKISLEKKDKYKAISMMIESENEAKTEENIKENIEKLINHINTGNYKNIVLDLKNKMENWDVDAFKRYSETISLAKKHWIK